jgi:site-specific DNA recombinase
MRVVGYSRVSTAEQVQSGISLEMQRSKIQAYGCVKDWVVSEIITDDGHSAKDLKRPGIQAIMNRIESNRRISGMEAGSIDPECGRS